MTTNNQIKQKPARDKVRSPLGSRIDEALADRPPAWLARECGLSSGSISEIRHGVMPGADKAVRIAEALGVTVEWLINGDAASQRAFARDDDTVALPRFDFGASPQEADGALPKHFLVRRAWIERLGKPNVLYWASEMPAPGVDGVAAAGDMLVCDFPTEHVQDRQHYIFLVGGVHPIVRMALVSADGIALHAGDPRAQDIVLPPGAPFGHGDNLTCVGRIAAVIQLRPL